MSDRFYRGHKPGEIHGATGSPVLVDGKWTRSCKCGRVFESHDNWEHVPTFYDHLATVPRCALGGETK